MTAISGKAAVVTGGGSGIGAGLARELARRGAAVAIADIIEGNARGTAEEIEAAGGRAIAIQCDVCDRNSIAAMKAAANAALGPVGLLVANAGATCFDPLLEMSDDDVDWIYQVNLAGVVNTTRAFLPDMVAAGSGHVMATSSMAGLLPGWVPVHVAYSSAKMGVIGFMMNLAMEMRAHGVCFTTYCPGGVASSMASDNARYRPERFGGPGSAPVAISEESFKDNPLDFFSPDSVAPMVLDAVEADRPFIFDHPEQRRFFQETYAAVVEACYDDSERWERRHGRPATVRTLEG